MISADLNLTANLPFVAIVVVVMLALAWIVVKHAVRLQLGPLKMAVDNNAKQLDNGPKDVSGNDTEPTIREYVKQIDAKMRIMGDDMVEVRDRAKTMSGQQTVMAATLNGTVARLDATVSRLDAFERQTTNEIARIDKQISGAA
jgi:hypothetical protein